MAAKQASLNEDQKALVCKLQKRYGVPVMFEVSNGKLLLCYEHWKQIKWKELSPKLLICKGVKLVNGYYFGTDLV